MFYLYQIHSLNAAGEKWSFIRNVKLSGPAGPLALHISRLPQTEAGAWAVPGVVLASLVTAGVGNYSLVYDPDPDNPTQVTLSRLTKVAGNTGENRTDLLLVFELLWSARRTENPQEFKKTFWLEKHAKGREHSEAVAITGGTNTEASTWKLTNPALNLGIAVVGRR
jgi:hypothetical protein